MPAHTLPVLLQRSAINTHAWNDCVRNATLPLVYAMSWYLDVVAPGWLGLVQADEHGNYQAVMPVPVQHTMGLKRIMQPPFAQQLGVFARAGIEINLYNWLEILCKKAITIQYALNSAQLISSLLPEDINTATRITYLLDLQPPYSQLTQGFKSNLRRSLQKSLPFTIEEHDDVQPMINLFRAHKGKVPGLKNRHYQVLAKLYEVLKAQGVAKLLHATEGGTCIAAALFVLFEGRITYLFSANSPRARKLEANAHLLNAIIGQHAGQPLVLDFEGGNMSTIGRYFKSFGAEPVPFTMVTFSRLPRFLQKLLPGD